ncbi:MAG: biotin--[acetyl-CoA-carboxylase] ligase, partial [Flavobacteriaceae bacterium]|nr:biotin--[acetyl-CoA-carboxylase] ligase [Flavobacteriaceae bacterium]
MKLVKLDAINSTNSYLKQLSKDTEASNWTVVSTEFQSSGRGQLQTKWESDKGKNLMCSVLIKLSDFNIQDHFYLNCAISLGIYEALQKYKLPQLKIKWPNDILSVNKKMGGILIENSLISHKIYQTIVGIGLNINQDRFPENLPQAVSMKQLLKKELDREALLFELIASIKLQIQLLEQKAFELLHQKYEAVLFKKNKA